MKTTQDCIAAFREMLLPIPAGTEVKWVEGGTGGYAVVSERLVAELSHDVFSAAHYYAWVPAEVVGED